MFGFLLAALLIPFSYHVESHLETAVHIQGGEAEAVDDELAQRFQSPFVHRVVLVVQGLPDPSTSEGSIALDDALDRTSTSLRAIPGVAAVLSHLDWQDPLFISQDPAQHPGTLLIVGLAPPDGNIEAMIPRLRAQAAILQTQLQPRFPNLHIELTGEVPLNFDLREVSSHDVSRAEARVLPVTLILLLLAFGSLIAALLPLGSGLLAISMTLGAASLLAHYLHLSILIQNIATMLGLGLGIDYALLMINRFREALAEGHPPGPAADLAAAQAGHTLLISAATVAIGFSALLTVPISELRSIGVAGLLVAAISVLLCTCILPWILGHLGHRINTYRPRLRRHRRPHDPAVSRSYSARWHRWGRAVTHRPLLALLLTGLPLLLLAYQGRHLTIAIPPGNWLPPSAPSVQALHSLESMQRDGIVQSLRVILELPPATPARSPAGWQALSRLTQTLAADPRTAEVVSLPTLLNMAPTSANFDRAPEPIRRSFLSTDARATLLEVLPATGLPPAGQILWVRELRAADIPRLTGIPGASIRIGGIAALNADYAAVVNQRLPRVVAGVVLGSLLALLLGLRSLFAAVKAVLLNLLSVGASFGALVLVIQEGHGARLLGFGSAAQSVFPIVPILAFAITFGLSMDYEVFLVARVLEERCRGLSNRNAIIEALASTARLITSAAAIMIVVFAAFTLGSFLVVKMLGFTLAVAVLLDATVVRMIVGPALLQLAGDWNWWPYGLRGAKPQAVLPTETP